jgi:hypothetical protein
VVNPTYAIVPPVAAGAAPALNAAVQAPEPAEAAEVYGDAQWMKVFKTQHAAGRRPVPELGRSVLRRGADLPAGGAAFARRCIPPALPTKSAAKTPQRV